MGVERQTRITTSHRTLIFKYGVCCWLQVIVWVCYCVKYLCFFQCKFINKFPILLNTINLLKYLLHFTVKFRRLYQVVCLQGMQAQPFGYIFINKAILLFNAWWTGDEISKKLTLKYFSKRAYVYVIQTLKYPLPALSTLQLQP